MKIDQILSSSESAKVIEAIALAEEKTNGEIRVHIEEKILEEELPMERAVKVFNVLNMHQTKERTGVLFYINASEKKLVILGDEGINTCVPSDFWESISVVMLDYFKNGAFTQGICQGIAMAGEKLSYFFPKTHDNENELPNEITTEADIH